MLLSPFFKIAVADTNEDITNLFDSIDYETSIEKDDLLNVSIKTKDVSLLDGEWLRIGKKLLFIFGYTGGLQSEQCIATISDLKFKYGDTITIPIKCTDAGAFAKNSVSSKIWKEQTFTNIAQTIASKYGLDLQAVETTKKYLHLPQANLNDFDFLQNIAKRENLQCYISNNQLNIAPADYLKKSMQTLRLEDMISFDIETKTSKDNPSSQAAKSTTINPYDLTQKEQVVTNTDKDIALQGNYLIDYSTGKTTRKQDTNSATTVVGKESDGAANKKQLLNKVQTSLQGSVKATAKIMGNPLLAVNQIITITGVAKIHEGNYLVESVKHQINNSGYFTTLELSKNATNKPVSVVKDKKGEEQKTNETKGAEVATKKKPAIYRYE